MLKASRKRILLLALITVAMQAQAYPQCFVRFADIFRKSHPTVLEGTFGPEFTFTNEVLVREGNIALNDALKHGHDPSVAVVTEHNMAKYLSFKEILIARCKSGGDCTTSIGHDKHGENIRVTYKDGWYFEVGIDMCVIETQTKPGRIADFVFNKERLETDLWKVAESLDLRPHHRAGQGHVHIGLSAFNHDPILLRNFFADYSNHPELAFGALGNHLGNSPPIAALKPEQRAGLTKALSEFDSLNKKSIPGFVKLIDQNVYTASTNAKWDGANYYHAIRLQRAKRINKASTVEIRAFRPQATADEFILQIELIQARINFLKDQPLVAYRDTGRYEYTPQEIVNSFNRYVTEAGLNWEKYKVLLPPNLRSIKVTDQAIRR